MYFTIDKGGSDYDQDFLIKNMNHYENLPMQYTEHFFTLKK